MPFSDPPCHQKAKFFLGLPAPPPPNLPTMFPYLSPPRGSLSSWHCSSQGYLFNVSITHVCMGPPALPGPWASPQGPLGMAHPAHPCCLPLLHCCVSFFLNSLVLLKARSCHQASLCFHSLPSQSIFLSSLCPTSREPLSPPLFGFPPPLYRWAVTSCCPLLHKPSPVPSPLPMKTRPASPIPFLDDCL